MEFSSISHTSFEINISGDTTNFISTFWTCISWRVRFSAWSSEQMLKLFLAKSYLFIWISLLFNFLIISALGPLSQQISTIFFSFLVKHGNNKLPIVLVNMMKWTHCVPVPLITVISHNSVKITSFIDIGLPKVLVTGAFCALINENKK